MDSTDLQVANGFLYNHSKFAMAPQVLVILTSQEVIPANNHPSGWYLVLLYSSPAIRYPVDALTPWSSA
jgi:hypothetical protein